MNSFCSTNGCRPNFTRSVNPLLDNTESQRIWTGMHADGGTDLIDGYLMDGISVFLQFREGMVAEGDAFFDIVAVAHSDAVAFDTEAALFQVGEKKLQRFLGGAFSSAIDAGGEDLAFLQGDYRADIQNTASEGSHFADASAVF